MFGLEEQSVRRSGHSWPPIAPIAACPAATSPDTDALLVTLQHAAACRRSPRAAEVPWVHRVATGQVRRVARPGQAGDGASGHQPGQDSRQLATDWRIAGN